ncbi:MAG: hypothetical protein K9J17_02590 [Flavobacteriales bacterium]|nr:hypothetical protein [Flavobacteriales bacterium]
MKTNEYRFHEEESKKRKALKEAHKQELLNEAEHVREEAIRNALQQAESRIPLSVPELTIHLQGLRYEYRKLLQMVHGWINPTNRDIERLRTESYENEMKETGADLEDVNNRLSNDPNVGKTAPDSVSLSKRLLSWLSYLLVLTEIAFDASAFSSLKLFYLVALFLAIGFNISKLVIIQLLTRLLKRTEKLTWKVAIMATTLLTMTGLFMMVAKLRLQTLANSGITETSGEMAFVTLSLFFFGAIWASHYLTEPIRGEIQVSRQRWHDHQKTAELRKKKQQLEARQQELRNLLVESAVEGELDRSEAEALFQMLEDHHRSTHSKFLTLYLKGRSNKGERIDDSFTAVRPEPLFGIEDRTFFTTTKND